MKHRGTMMRADRRCVLGAVVPVVRYGLREARNTSVAHAMTEVGVISYLMGMGMGAGEAKRVAEAWEPYGGNRRMPMEEEEEEEY